jgi:PAS domain-containing protein
MKNQWENNQTELKNSYLHVGLGADKSLEPESIVQVHNISKPKLAEQDEAIITLLENGMILNCNKAGAELLASEPDKLTWLPIARLLPQLADLALVLDEKVNPYLQFLSLVGHRFEVIAMNGAHFASELFFSEVEEFGRNCLRVVLRPIRAGQPLALRHLKTY